MSADPLPRDVVATPSIPSPHFLGDLRAALKTLRRHIAAVRQPVGVDALDQYTGTPSAR
jgi:hypothetical protein